MNKVSKRKNFETSRYLLSVSLIYNLPSRVLVVWLPFPLKFYKKGDRLSALSHSCLCGPRIGRHGDFYERNNLWLCAGVHPYAKRSTAAGRHAGIWGG